LTMISSRSGTIMTCRRNWWQKCFDPGNGGANTDQSRDITVLPAFMQQYMLAIINSKLSVNFIFTLCFD